MAVSRLAAAARVLTIEWCRGSVLGWARPTPCRGGVCFYNSIVTQSGRGGGGAGAGHGNNLNIVLLTLS